MIPYMRGTSRLAITMMTNCDYAEACPSLLCTEMQKGIRRKAKSVVARRRNTQGRGMRLFDKKREEDGYIGR